MAQVHEFEMQMTCEGCANAAKKVLSKKGDQVQDIVTNIAEQKVSVSSTLSSDELLEALRKTGKQVSYLGIKQ